MTTKNPQQQNVEMTWIDRRVQGPGEIPSDLGSVHSSTAYASTDCSSVCSFKSACERPPPAVTEMVFPPLESDNEESAASSSTSYESMSFERRPGVLTLDRPPISQCDLSRLMEVPETRIEWE